VDANLGNEILGRATANLVATPGCATDSADGAKLRRTEEPSGESDRLLELFFSQSLDGLFFMMLDEPVRWDDDADKDAVLEYVFSHQRITRVNDAMLAQYGATREQLIGCTPRDFYAHDEAYGKALWRRFFDARQLRVETDERRVDGSPIRIEGDYICIEDGAGRITGHFGIQRDVTDRHRAVEALRLSEVKFARIFHSAPLRVSISTLEDGRLLEINDTFLRDLGLTREEVIGRTAIELGLYAHPEDRERMLQELARRGIVRDFEFDGLTRGGRHEVTLLSADAIVLDGRPCVLALAFDITERKRAEAASRRSRRELRALAARLQTVREQERAHIAREIHDELGQALTALKFDLAWLQGHLSAHQPQLVGRARSAVTVVDETIASVHRIATELRPSVLDHLGLVAAIEWQAAELERRTDIRATLDLPADDLSIKDARITTVFRILQETLTNVARHAQATRVTITLRSGRRGLLLKVRDNGRGITPQELTSVRSLGLVGLRERALACSGKLRIEGSPGEGTTVTLHVPLRPSSESLELA
jgi:PAS domain S-box-containing protein